MLKRLELLGFKSFADRTRFDFAPGVTAIVGPNGSGKSNVVDAVRWLLGEQSAKSLRGGEMTDVIFNGSASRKSLGLAEVTMTFDNTKHVLDSDADEVQVTRRVYRDGTGEYVVNGREARLKDVKDLFLGSGAGHGAYSVIEQGRVDALLTASTKDRRVIFEEAAGISRFKAKKAEALKKLERLDVDLSRVRDILHELDKQLRALRLQAAKAQRYQEHTARLREVRVGQALAEYHRTGVELAREEAFLASARSTVADLTGRAAGREEELRELDSAVSRADEGLRGQAARLAAARQAIAAQEATGQAERGQAEALERERARVGLQRAELAGRVRALEAEAGRVETELDFLHQRVAAEESRAGGAERALEAAAARLAELGRLSQAERDGQFAAFRLAAQRQGEADLAAAQLDRLARERERKAADAAQARTRHDALARLLADLSRTDADLRLQLEEARQAVASRTAQRQRLRQLAEGMQPDLDRMRGERHTLRGQAGVLEGLERSFEGVGAGVRAVLERRRAGEPALAAGVVGIVADLLTVPREVAPLVDLALGEAAQRVVVRDAEALATILWTLGELPGRVGFVPLAASPPEPPPDGLGVPLSDFVQSAWEGLPRQLLGRVFLRDDPAGERPTPARPGDRFVSRQGELWEADGTVSVGPPLTGTGLLSRKSELRDLTAQIAALDQRLSERGSAQAELRRQADALDRPVLEAEADVAALSGQAGTLREQLGEQRQAQRQLADALDALARDAEALDLEIGRSERTLAEARAAAEAGEREAHAAKARFDATAGELAHAEAERERKNQEHTAAQVTLSRVNEQSAGLGKRREELDAELAQRRLDAANLSESARAARARLEAATLAVLRAGALAATAYADKEAGEAEVRRLTRERELARAARRDAQAALKGHRDAWSQRHEQAHAHELAARDVAARRAAVAGRVREEYGLDLATLPPPTHSSQPEAAAAEIADLRSKIAKLGSVNIEAIAELAEVEAREGDLRRQFDDLTQGQARLREIIDQINRDSRTLFADTLAAIRGHFQELFRKLFGGGVADITLEDESDVLESGIEITAQPPGKQPQRLTLLSGGERALTAVALLLAIFRTRPSPFCLLDEIDAAMDEANTQRLAERLGEFRESSQFVVITHKKRTMARADVLHGVTMQESGVSKLVAVRFEDWPEDGENAERAAA